MHIKIGTNHESKRRKQSTNTRCTDVFILILPLNLCCRTPLLPIFSHCIGIDTHTDCDLPNKICIKKYYEIY